MFDSKSDYALNKLDREAIVCKTACGAYVRLTEADFSSREEFLRWKEISDQDYHDTETRQQEDDHCLSLNDRMGAAVPSAEEKLLAAIGLHDQASVRAELLQKLKGTLTEVQYRRLMMHLVEKKTTREIAALEGVAQQVVSKSIIAARKKIFRRFFHSTRK